MDISAGEREVEKESPAVEVLGREIGGFNFDLFRRNQMMLGKSGTLPRMKKTGTTIVGVTYKDGVVLGADTRATNGDVIADKNCQKIHYMAPNIWCCGAGTAADTEHITEMMAGQLELLRFATGTQSRVVAAMTMLKRRLFEHQGHISAALVLGGVDVTGPHLYTIYPHGSTDKLPFVTMGSGSLAAMAVFEAGYKDDLTEEEAVLLVRAAINAGIFNDLGSGGNCDVCVINSEGARVTRGVDKKNEGSELRAKHTRPASRLIPPGATAVLKTVFEKHVTVTSEVVTESKMEDD